MQIRKNLAILIGILAVTGISLVVFLVRRFRRTRDGRSAGGPGTAQALATELGYDYVRKPDKIFRKRFVHIPEIKNGENKHAIWGDLDGRQITFFNNSYIVPAGQMMIPVMHCVFACEAPQWPTLCIAPKSFWNRLFARITSSRGITLENQAFNDAFKITCDDENFAVTLLSQEMQAFMLDKTTGMKWRIGSEMVCMVYNGTLKLKRAPASLDRMRRFWSLVPQELEHW